MLSLSISASAYDFKMNDVYFSVISNEDMTCKVVSGDEKYKGNIVIPSEVSFKNCNYSVKEIGESAFTSCFELTSVTISSSIVSIEEGSFGGSMFLKEILVVNDNQYYSSIGGVLCNKDGSTIIAYPNGKGEIYKIPDSVTKIGNKAFGYCYHLTSVTIPRSVIEIGDSAFYNCALTNVNIPNSVTKVGISAFEECRWLTDVIIGNAVTTLGQRAFYNCEALSSVNLPASITEIKEETFFRCNSLTSVSIPNSVKKIGKYSFSECKSLGSVAIPNTVTEIGESSFSGCNSLVSVSLSNSIKKIEKNSFYNCSSLTSVIIPDSVTEIDMQAFYGCYALTSVTIPSSVTEIGNGAFAYCGSLISIDLPETLTEIKGQVFMYCRSLTSLKLPDSIRSIGNMAFQSCSSLISVTIPKSVESIFGNVFLWCSNLIEISVVKDNPYYSSIDGVLYNKDCTTLHIFPNAKGNEYILPYSVRAISSEAFCSCKTLTSVTIQKPLEAMGSYAFADCPELTSVYYNCEYPTDFYDDSIFTGSLDYATLYVPENAIERYYDINPWQQFYDIQGYDFSVVEPINIHPEKTVIGRFDISGYSVDEDHKGIVIEYFSDGTIQKIIQK